MMYKKIIINNIETDYSIAENGIVRNDKTGKDLKGSKGYNCWYFQLSVNQKKSNYNATKLMECFLPEKPSHNAIVYHKDGNVYNNHIDNLYWYDDTLDESWKDVMIDGEKTGFVVNQIGQVKNSKTGNILKGDTSKSYQYFNLRYNGKQKMKSGHRLVAEAFLPNPNNLPYVHHKDHNRLNNNVNNLQWVSEQENALDCLPIQKKESCYSLTYNSLPNEIWKNYKDTHYEVSNLGRVRNLKTMRIVKGSLRDDGYVGIKLNKKSALVHKIVAESFLGDIPIGYDVNHINHIKTDNRIENLEIISHSDNMKQAVLYGKCGSKFVGRFDFEGNLLQVYRSASEAARDIGILPSSMRNIINYREGKRGKEIFKYLEESSSTNRDKNPEAQNTI